MDWVGLASELAEEFAARADEVDRSGRFPTENLERLRETGYLAMPVPVDLGGGGADLATVCQAQGVLAGGCASTALAINMHVFGLGSAAEAHAEGEEESRMILEIAASGMVIGGSFTDAATGLNVRTSATPARRVEGGYVVSGRKSFCSLAPVLDLFYGTAQVVDDGPLLVFGLPRETKGLRFEDTWDTMSMRGTGSWDVIFDDVFVPAAMAREATFTDWQRPNERMFAWFSFTVASVYLGIARAAQSFTRDYVSSRTLGGMSLPMARQPGTIFSAAEIETLLRPAEALLSESIRRRAVEVLTADDIAAVKYVAVNAAVAAVDRCLRMTGGHGLYRRLPLERYYRDVRAGPVHPPNNDGAFETIGKAALGIPIDAEPRWGG